jgi:hypothetical protein
VDRPSAPAEIRQVVESLWGPEYQRALDVAWCESRFDLQAKNPTSSASGLFQLLAPWTREPGTGRTVWGWEFTESGEKLSAAAGLRISEDDARWTLRNAEVAYEIYRRAGGWKDWSASRNCWG